MVEDNDEYVNDEDEGKFEIPPSKNSRDAQGKAEKGDFNEALRKNCETYIQSLKKTEKSLAWGFY